MTSPNRYAWRRLRSLTWAPLALALAASTILMLLPPRTTAPLKSTVAELLSPGQKLGIRCREQVANTIGQFTERLAAVDEQQALRAELVLLRRRSEELELALAATRLEANAADSADSSGNLPLVRAALVRARVLGPQARSFLERLEVLDAGSVMGLEPGALAVDGSTVVLDQGRNAGLKADDLALAGRRILGKLVEVGPQTSVMRRTTDAGYRDLVQVAAVAGDRLRLGPRGVLEGVGEPLCRIRMIETTEPVSEGDLVLASGEAGASSFGAVYGRVARVERQPGDAHWRIWMSPATDQESLKEAAVLKLQLNPARVARSESETGSK
jgi:cell shape-determining protein MreC